MSTCFLLLWLEAPLQSWGFDSKFSRRDSINFPTKSGILGLLCCALGAGGQQKELLARMAPLKTTVLAFSRTEAKQPLLHDFHMVGGGYSISDSFECNMIPKTSEGKKPNGSGVKLSHRYYLQDVAFGVAIEVPSDLAEPFANALQAPVWDLYLGRKNCAPTEFIYQGIFDNESFAIERAAQIANEKKLKQDFKVLDGEHEGEVIVLNDVPIQFGERKEYRQRHITIM